MTDKMLAALNDQLNFELASSYIYASMAAYLESIDMKGFADWMKAQTAEEVAHAQKFYQFIYDRGGRVTYQDIPQPPAEWDGVKAAFEAALAHEKIVTGRIFDLVDLALEERDHAANAFLQWFVTEQVEEEATADEWIKKIEMASDHPASMMMLDREAAARAMPALSGPAEE